MSGVLNIVLGVLVLMWGQWYMPRAMQRIRQKIVDRGRDPAKFDAMLTSRRWPRLLTAVTVCGAALVIVGVWFVVSGE